jgi:hypothetical protein
MKLKLFVMVISAISGLVMLGASTSWWAVPAMLLILFASNLDNSLKK